MRLLPRGFRTPRAQVRGLGASRSGTTHFWHERLTAVAGIPLTIAFVVIVVSLLGRNHAATLQILGSPLITILMLLFIANSVYHMWLGMQVIIEDYVHHELRKLGLLMANTFFCVGVGVASTYALLKIGFGV